METVVVVTVAVNGTTMEATVNVVIIPVKCMMACRVGYDGMSCGGPSRGQCRCGACMCRQGYIGEACECPTDTSTCIQPNHHHQQQQDQQHHQQGPSVCSNKGTCQCGRCRCEDGYKGMFCEDTVYAAGVCEKLRSCVLCQAWRRELISCNHCQVSLHVVESLEPSMTTCVMVNAGCIMKYSYQDHHNNSYTVKLQRNSDCPPQIE
ncbi:hypothetical protein Pmani_038062 [Petrolisthes manimaculis]|uniref:Integrin beta subunit tail domain-containing protein n=1 Tax=Petrolisthes manimaculis TaxID=1843537 RepID=A0AAE1NF35_9EUCA|nr:hypothetical protein Pmani_038062 [Petrolisthes manimaculis]